MTRHTCAFHLFKVQSNEKHLPWAGSRMKHYLEKSFVAFNVFGSVLVQTDVPDVVARCRKLLILIVEIHRTPNFVCRFHHILQSRNCLGPCPSLESTIRVHHEPLDVHALQKAPELLLNEIYRGNNWRVNVIGPWTEVFGVPEIPERP